MVIEAVPVSTEAATFASKGKHFTEQFPYALEMVDKLNTAVFKQGKRFLVITPHPVSRADHTVPTTEAPSQQRSDGRIKWIHVAVTMLYEM